MGIFKHIKDCRPHRDINSKGTNPIVLENLEPRILLSGDGLLNIADENTNDESINEDSGVDIVSPTQVDSEPGLQVGGSDVGIALVLGVDLFEENDVQPIGEDVDSECFESCQRQLIIEQLTDTLTPVVLAS